MVEAKFTQGPWKFIDATKIASMQFRPLCIIRGDGRQVASFSWNDSSPYWPTKAESQANAHLIAAAPEMYEALNDLAGCVEYHAKRGESVPLDNEHLISARTALAKAEGRS